MSFSPTDQGKAPPKAWTLASLSDVAELNPRPNLSAFPDEQEVHFVPMAAAAEDFRGLDISARRRLTEVRKGYTAFQGGDVLLAKITPCMENGKGGLVPMLPMHLAFGSTEFHVLRPANVVEGRWLSHFLSQRSFRRVARQNMTGTAGQLRVPSKWLADVKIPVAPKSEQERVVAKLDELLSDLDVGVAELKAAQQKLQRYRQSLLKAAVEGALTAEWRTKNPPTETGEELLQRILRERRARWEEQQLAKFAAQGKAPPKGWKDKYPEPQPPKTAGLPVLPEGWVWASVEQLGHVGTGSTPLRSNPQYFEGGKIPWVTSGALNSEIVTASAESVTEKAMLESHLDLYPAGTLLVAMYGEGKTRGKSSELGFDATINQAIAAIVMQGQARDCKAWLKAFLLSNYEAMRGRSSGGVQPNLNLQIIKSLPVPLPPFSEQIESLDLLWTQLEQVIKQAALAEYLEKICAAQRQNLLRAAFRGELVPQNPNDEPASVLLERLRSERNATAKPTKAEHKTRKAARVA